MIRVDPRYPGIWEDVRWFLELAIARGDGRRDWGLDDIREQAENGAVELWALIDDGELVGAGVTCRSYYPQRTVLEVLAFGCQKSKFETAGREALLQLQAIAKSLGVQALVGTGRPGWIKKIPISRYRYVWEIDLSPEGNPPDNRGSSSDDGAGSRAGIDGANAL